MPVRVPERSAVGPRKQEFHKCSKKSINLPLSNRRTNNFGSSLTNSTFLSKLKVFSKVFVLLRADRWQCLKSLFNTSNTLNDPNQIPNGITWLGLEAWMLKKVHASCLSVTFWNRRQRCEWKKHSRYSDDMEESTVIGGNKDCLGDMT